MIQSKHSQTSCVHSCSCRLHTLYRVMKITEYRCTPVALNIRLQVCYIYLDQMCYTHLARIATYYYLYYLLPTTFTAGCSATYYSTAAAHYSSTSTARSAALHLLDHLPPHDPVCILSTFFVTPTTLSASSLLFHSLSRSPTCPNIV